MVHSQNRTMSARTSRERDVDLSQHTADELRAVADELNDRPARHSTGPAQPNESLLY